MFHVRPYAVSIYIYKSNLVEAKLLRYRVAPTPNIINLLLLYNKNEPYTIEIIKPEFSLWAIHTSGD